MKMHLLFMYELGRSVLLIYRRQLYKNKKIVRFYRTFMNDLVVYSSNRNQKINLIDYENRNN